MIWTNDFVGIPYADMGRDRAGCDCWGLARLVYAERLEVDLPSYAGGYVSAEEQAEVSALIGQETEGSVWLTSPLQNTFDLLVFRHGRHQSHIGIVVERGLMLHMATDDQSKLERFDQGRWKSRLVGAFSHNVSDLRGVL